MLIVKETTYCTQSFRQLIAAHIPERELTLWRDIFKKLRDKRQKASYASVYLHQ